MRVMVLGSGGREHALVWKLRQSPKVQEVLCVPGNGGIERIARCIAVPLGDPARLRALAQKEKIDLVVVGPEVPLADGIVDQLEGFAVLGPSRQGAKLESSKVFAKEFMARHGIPTAGFIIEDRAEEALRYLDSNEARFPIVVKADGLAAGKGVVVAKTKEEAQTAVRRIMIDREFGDAGDRIVVEDCLEGREASFIVFTDGDTIVPAVPSQDHKAAHDGDSGPNTGGMGAFSSGAILDPAAQSHVIETIIRPTIQGMEKEGARFRGILYAGLMMTSSGPRVLEFNVRMGDPEAQVILPRLGSDFALLCEHLCSGTLADYDVHWKPDVSVCVVLASGGYPGAYEKGKLITGIEMAEEEERVVVFHSGTRFEGKNLLTHGGRVLGVTATCGDLPSAVMVAYEAVNKIHFDAMHYRKDIGARGIGLALGGKA